MTLIEEALKRSWEGYCEQDEAGFKYLHIAVSLISDWIKAQEARSLPPPLPQDAPEAPAGSNVPPDWKDRYNRQREATESALYWLRANCKNKAIEELEKVL